MANSLPSNSIQGICQLAKVRLNRITQACCMGLVEVVSSTTGRAGIFTCFKQSNGGAAYLSAIGALKFNSVGMGIHRLASRGLG